jgi:hypothetical protein
LLALLERRKWTLFQTARIFFKVQIDSQMAGAQLVRSDRAAQVPFGRQSALSKKFWLSGIMAMCDFPNTLLACHLPKRFSILLRIHHASNPARNVLFFVNSISAFFFQTGAWSNFGLSLRLRRQFQTPFLTPESGVSDASSRLSAVANEADIRDFVCFWGPKTVAQGVYPQSHNYFTQNACPTQCKPNKTQAIHKGPCLFWGPKTIAQRGNPQSHGFLTQNASPKQRKPNITQATHYSNTGVSDIGTSARAGV